jgi:Recombinase zinc beta ribbon domain
MRSPRATRARSPLTGLAVCASCGSALTGSTVGTPRSYRCSAHNRRHKGAQCDAPALVTADDQSASPANSARSRRAPPSGARSRATTRARSPRPSGRCARPTRRSSPGRRSRRPTATHSGRAATRGSLSGCVRRADANASYDALAGKTRPRRVYEPETLAALDGEALAAALRDTFERSRSSAAGAAC